jgi:isopentenyl-diphosphate delta-isomerase type 1
MKQYPPIQIVNQADKPIGSASLEEIHTQGLRHRIVYIICEDPTGRILLQKRALDMSTYPGCWDISAAGHVDEGETYEAAAKRELQEELGLSGFTLQKVKNFYDETVFEGRHLNRFCQVYKTIVPADTQLQPNPSEVTATQWLTLDEIKQLNANNPDQIAAGIYQVLLT